MTGIVKKNRVFQKNDLQLKMLLFFTVFVHAWGWVFFHTKFESTFFANLMKVAIFVVAFIYLRKKKPRTFSALNIVWIPYLLVTVVGLVISIKYILFFSWFTYLIIILVAACSDILKATPVKLLLWSGVFLSASVYFEFFFQSFYNSYLADFFVGHAAENFEEQMMLDFDEVNGLHGFTYNGGTTAQLIMFGLIALVFSDKIQLPRFFQKKYMLWTLFLLMIVSIFFTGKRTLSILSVVIPAMVYFLSQGSELKRFLLLIIGFIFVIFLYNFLLPVLMNSSHLFVMGRITETISEAQSGRDITTGRILLWDMAIKAWLDNPLLGVGVGNYREYTGAFTSTHNVYLQVLCEQGILGFIPYVVALFTLLIKTIRLVGRTNNTELKSYLQMSLAFQLVYILDGFTENPNSNVSIALCLIGAAITIRCSYLLHLNSSVKQVV